MANVCYLCGFTIPRRAAEKLVWSPPVIAVGDVGYTAGYLDAKWFAGERYQLLSAAPGVLTVVLRRSDVAQYLGVSSQPERLTPHRAAAWIHRRLHHPPGHPPQQDSLRLGRIHRDFQVPVAILYTCTFREIWNELPTLSTTSSLLSFISFLFLLRKVLSTT